MKSSKVFLILVALFFAVTTTTHAGGLIEMVSGFFGGGKDRGPQTSGKVTVRGLSKYEGKFVMGLADSDPALLAAGNITSGGVITAAAVKGGKAALKVWRSDGGAYGSFDGNAAGTLLLSVYDGEAPTDGIAMGLVEVKFRKGKGSGTGAFIGNNAFGGTVGRVLDNVYTAALSGLTIAASGNANAFGDMGALGDIVGSAVGDILGNGSGGTLTMTGIPSEYNGNWLYIGLAGSSDDDDLIIQGFQSANLIKGGGVDIYGVRISGGRANIPIWDMTDIDDWEHIPRYSGNHRIGFLGSITDSDTSIMESTTLATFSAGVEFRNGSAAIAWSDMRSIVGELTIPEP